MESTFFSFMERSLLVNDNNDTNISNSSGYYNSTHDGNDQQQQQEEVETATTEISFSAAQQIAVTLIPIFSGLISAMASCALLYKILSDGRHQQQRKLQKQPNNRHLLVNNADNYCDSDDAGAESSSHTNNNNNNHNNNNNNTIMARTSFCQNNISSDFSVPSFRIRTPNTRADNDTNNHQIQQRQQKQKQKFPLAVYHRIMIGLTVCDFVGALRAAMSTFVLPADTIGFWKSYGNTATCTFQGFLLQSAGMSGMLYTMSLGIYFYMTIVYAIKDDTMKRRFEPFLHAIPIVYSACTSITGIFLDVYNPLPFGASCWVAPYPASCTNNDTNSNGVECIRGKNYAIIRLIFLYAPLLICYGVLIFCMMGIYYSVRKQIRYMALQYGDGNVGTTAMTPAASSKATTTITRTPAASTAAATTTTTPTTTRKGSNFLPDRSKKRLQRVSTQSQLYISVYFLVYGCATIGRVLEVADGNINSKFAVTVLGLIFYPSQGFFNFIIYIRPQIMQIQTVHPKLSRWKALRIVLRFEPEPPIVIPRS